MRTSTLSILFAVAGLFCGITPNLTRAGVIYELVDVPPEGVTVGQAFPYSTTHPFPVDGTPTVVWGRLTNTGSDVFEAIGPSDVGGGQHSVGTGVLIWFETHNTWWSPEWNPDNNPDDPYFFTDDGFPAFRLYPGESLALPAVNIWGLTGTSESVGWPNAYSGTFAPAPIGNVSVLYELSISFWEGLDSDPADGTNPPEMTTLSAGDLTMTVVPEPSVICLVAAGLLAFRRSLRFTAPR